ncbi:uncharacterized protein FIBRA_02798 [Fibroporia radiculosa]|uniref:Protein kinase domain-containing protein n=1 Tax=Fibroporia radiculosa TaxID=599839 RepID=J4G2T1_9APHY|nr:uncharacterized protein FIBRA_02798 [Fibroporia radiculosa]CCM00758.1 predicted protein [Fibroporia radiculosa]
MSLSWSKRKSRLAALLNIDEDEDAQALALDRILHGQNVIGKTSKTTQIDSLRFSDGDLDVVGTLEYGQYGVIDVVTCKLDGCVYVRKSTEKRFALKMHDASGRPQFERDILLAARRTESRWAPHLLAAFQTSTHLNLVMSYAEGGTLWDVLESSPHDGRILESDLRWWAPQLVSAIEWCHSQGFAHRDIKPHNFVLTPGANVLLIDFGSAAPLLPPASDGSQVVPKQYCLVPCGTCDYISPEILQAHEEALVALEMADDDNLPPPRDGEGGYGRETDWWSMGAMLYEMVYGVAPFFAKDIRRTYIKITDHHNNLRLLTSAELRLGRTSAHEIKEHPFFDGTDWSRLHETQKPDELHLPQFTYSTPVVATDVSQASLLSPQDASESRPFAFSALFQSSPPSTQGASTHLLSLSNMTTRSAIHELPIASFIGFSWGPSQDAFKKAASQTSPIPIDVNTPRPLRCFSVSTTPFLQPPTKQAQATPIIQRYPFATPVRPNLATPYQTLPRASTIRRTAPRRAVSDREALKQLVDCVGMSARKKVLESGRKPRILTSFSRSSTLKELRFDTSVAVVGATGGVSFKAESATITTQSEDTFGTSSVLSGMASMSAGAASATQEILVPDLSFSDVDSDIPYSPSPSPRPGSAMSILSRRSQTPTTTSFNLFRAGMVSQRSADGFKRPTPTAEMAHFPSREITRINPKDAEAGEHTSYVSYDLFDDFEKRYTVLLEDISGLELRLARISTSFRNSS